jgi:hypothetical protein
LLFEAQPDNQYCATFLPSSQIDLSKFSQLSIQRFYGCIGLINIDNELFVGLIQEATLVAELESHNIFQINKVGFYSLASKQYDRDNERTQNAQSQPEDIQHPCSPVIKLLSTGSFYFSQSLDLTKPLINRIDRIDRVVDGKLLFDQTDKTYIWNKTIIEELLDIFHEIPSLETKIDIDSSGLLVSLIQGFINSRPIMIKKTKCQLVIISRLSANRAGTRFNARGINDDGHVSNFVQVLFI